MGHLVSSEAVASDEEQEQWSTSELRSASSAHRHAANTKRCPSGYSRTRGGKSLAARTFFVVGDIGEPGEERRLVAQAMAAQLSSGEVQAEFVLSTGDNFYGCKSSGAFLNAFPELQEDMLEVVPLPWYFVLGNHDVKHGGSEAHLQSFHRRKGQATSVGKGKGWEFRCPSSYYSQGVDWEERRPSESPPWDPELLELLVVNTNKRLQALNVVGLKHGQLQASTSSWNDQKIWIRDSLAKSCAKWKIVAGHHPIEIIPYSYVEHGIPGVSFITSSFMKGHYVTRNQSFSLRDVIVCGGADVYLCGHQHLMGHLVRQKEDLSRSGIASADIDYVIIGSSSKLDQDPEDLDSDLSDDDGQDDSPGHEGETRPQALEVEDIESRIFCNNLDRSPTSVASASARLQTLHSRSDASSARGEDSDFPASSSRDSSRSNSFACSLRMVNPFAGRDIFPCMPSSDCCFLPLPKSRIEVQWRKEKFDELTNKMSTVWCAEKIGYAVVDVTERHLRTRFFKVAPAEEGLSRADPKVTLLRDITKTK